MLSEPVVARRSAANFIPDREQPSWLERGWGGQ